MQTITSAAPLRSGGFRALRPPLLIPLFRGRTHLTFAATEEIASLLRFFLLDTAVPMLKWKQPRGENADHSTDWSARDADKRESRVETAKWKASVHTTHDLNYLMFISAACLGWQSWTLLRSCGLCVKRSSAAGRCRECGPLRSALLIQLKRSRRKPDHKRKRSPRGCRTARTGAGWAAARGDEHDTSLHGCIWDEKRCGHLSPHVIMPLITGKQCAWYSDCGDRHVQTVI